VCPAPFEKIFWFSEDANQLYILAILSQLRGAFRERHGTSGRDAVDAAARETGDAKADGEDVWS